MRVNTFQAPANGSPIIAPGGYGWAMRPVGSGAAFPVRVQPDGDPGREISISDAGSLLMAKRFSRLEIPGQPAGAEWEVTVLEDLAEWRTSQADTRAGGQLIAGGTFNGNVPAGGNVALVAAAVDVSGFSRLLLKSKADAPATGNLVHALFSTLPTGSGGDGGRDNLDYRMGGGFSTTAGQGTYSFFDRALSLAAETDHNAHACGGVPDKAYPSLVNESGTTAYAVTNMVWELWGWA